MGRDKGCHRDVRGGKLSARKTEAERTKEAKGKQNRDEEENTSVISYSSCCVSDNLYSYLEDHLANQSLYCFES